MSWPDFLTPWDAGPAPAPPLQVLVLAALTETARTLRDQVSAAVFCAGCDGGRLCPDHKGNLELASQYEAAYMRIRGIGSDGAMLTLIGGLT